MTAAVLPRGAPRDAETLLAHCRAQLARHKVPAQLHFTDALPKTAVNKTDKNALRRLAALTPRLAESGSTT